MPKIVFFDVWFTLTLSPFIILKIPPPFRFPPSRSASSAVSLQLSE